MPIPEGATAALAEKLRRLRRHLLETPTGTHMDLLKELEPVLFVRYRFSVGSSDPWERFKAADQAGFVEIKGAMTTMFDSRMTMTSVLRKAAAKGTTKLAGDVQAGRQCSPKQALDELLQVERNWDNAVLDAWKLLKWTVWAEDTTKHAASVPSDVIESLFDEKDFGNVPPNHQRRFLNGVAKNELRRVTLRGFAVLTRDLMLAVTGANLTVLKLIECAGFDPCAAEVLGGCVLERIAKKCTALECLEIRGAPEMTKLAAVGLVVDGPLSFRSLKVCYVGGCAALRSIWLKSVVKGRLRVQRCENLKSVRVEGNIQLGKCSFDDCPQLEVSTAGVVLKTLSGPRTLDWQLTHLDLRGNKLTALPAEIGQLSVLKDVNLSDNRLRSVPPGFWQLVSLQELNLGFNRLTSLPAEIGLLISLKRLDLGNNGLSSLPVEIGQLVGLETLNLGNTSYDDDNTGIRNKPKQAGFVAGRDWSAHQSPKVGSYL